VPVSGYDAGTPSFSSVDISGTISSDYKYSGGVLLPSGKVVSVPYSAANVGVFDPATDTLSLVGDAMFGSNKYSGGVLLPSGKVVFVPYGADNVGVFDPGNPEPAYTVEGGVPDAWRALLSPHFNKS
jgi:hypothetical protein